MTAGRKVITENKDWCTPPKYVNAIRNFFGGAVDLDPCSSPHSVVQARNEYMLPAHDGLRESWNYGTIYVNPPYGRDRDRGTTIKDWLQKCSEAYRFCASEVIALVPVATNTSHWKQYVYGKASAICFLYDTRLRFLVNGKDGGKGAPMSCALVYWGSNYERFFQEFTKFGAVVSIENLKAVPLIGHGRTKQNQPALV